MILTTLPDLPPRPETAANAEFRRRFHARWGRENAVVCGHAMHAEYSVFAQTLSFNLVPGGSERFSLARRELAVDDDSWLVLNEGARCARLLTAARRRGPSPFSCARGRKTKSLPGAPRRASTAAACGAPDRLRHA
jgi:hypothetical protein